MSSILDALRKLEKEKSAARRRAGQPVDDVTAARELVGGYSAGSGVELSTRQLVFGGVAAAVLLVVISVAISAALLNRGTAPAIQQASTALTLTPTEPAASPQSATPEVTPTPAPVVPTPPPVPPVEEAVAPTVVPEVAASAVETETVAAAPKPAPVPETAPAKPVAQDPAPRTAKAVEPKPVAQPVAAPVAAPPEPEPAPVQEPMVVAQSSAPAPVPAAASPAEAPMTPVADPASAPAASVTPAQAPKTEDRVVDKASLPLLTISDRQRYGLSNMKINMVRPVNDNNPYASAIINLVPVYVGETIPNSSVKLVDVDLDLIVVQVNASGERFVIPIR